MTEQNKLKIRPAGKVQLGNVKAAIWKRTNEQGRTRYATTFERTYKAVDGKYRSMDDFNPQELISLIEVARLAVEWIRQDESKDESKNVEAQPVSEMNI